MVDPLIRGLNEVAQNRPDDPIEYLGKFLQDFSKQQKTVIFEPNNGIRMINWLCVFSIEHQTPRVDTPPIPSMTNDLERATSSQPDMPIITNPQRRPSDPIADCRVSLNNKTKEEEGRELWSNIIFFQDEHGQSVLHFASARFHGENAIIQLIEKSEVNIAYRDELYRTARDVSMQATQPDNTKEIDKFVENSVARGNTNSSIMHVFILMLVFRFWFRIGDIEILQNLLIDGYDHILDACDQIISVANSHGHINIARFLESVTEFEVNRINQFHSIWIWCLSESLAQRPHDYWPAFRTLVVTCSIVWDCKNIRWRIERKLLMD